MEWTNRPELFALVAFQEGAINGPQLRRAVREWSDGQHASVEHALVAHGALSPGQHHALARQMTRCDAAHTLPPEPKSTPTQADIPAPADAPAQADAAAPAVIASQADVSAPHAAADSPETPTDRRRRRQRIKEDAGYDYYEAVRDH